MREFNEASRLSDEINAMISQRGSLPPTGPETQRQLTAMRRKITILRTRLENLEACLSKLPSIQPMYVFLVPVSLKYSSLLFFGNHPGFIIVLLLRIFLMSSYCLTYLHSSLQDAIPSCVR